MTGLLQRENNNDADSQRRREPSRRPSKDMDSPSRSQPALAPGHPDYSADLGHAVACEIIPRLLASWGSDKTQPANGPLLVRGSRAYIGVEDFATLLINQREAEISDCLFNLFDQGATVEWLYLELMTRTARHIGTLWEQDRCGMVDVTLALGSLQNLMHQYSPVFQRECLSSDSRRRALLLPALGEQHTFGLSLIGEFFRRAGWDLWGWPMLQEKDLMSLVRNEWFAVVGFTIGAEVNLAGLTALIRDLRRVSSNRSLRIMIGGPLVLKFPQLVKTLGADATGVDARQAVRQAESLLRLQ